MATLILSIFPQKTFPNLPLHTSQLFYDLVTWTQNCRCNLNWNSPNLIQNSKSFSLVLHLLQTSATDQIKLSFCTAFLICNLYLSWLKLSYLKLWWFGMLKFFYFGRILKLRPRDRSYLRCYRKPRPIHRLWTWRFSCPKLIVSSWFPKLNKRKQDCWVEASMRRIPVWVHTDLYWKEYQDGRTTLLCFSVY